MTDGQIKVRDAIAQILSNKYPPAVAATRRAERIMRSLEEQGYVLVPADWIRGSGRERAAGEALSSEGGKE